MSEVDKDALRDAQRAMLVNMKEVAKYFYFRGIEHDFYNPKEDDFEYEWAQYCYSPTKKDKERVKNK